MLARSAAEALARGRSEADAEAAARDAVEELVAALADDAAVALDELVEVRPGTSP